MAPSLTIWLLEKHQVRRLRKAGYAAVRLGKPFGETPGAHAELALLRALTLEKELRRASLFRSRESVAAMARGIIESVLRGLYILADPNNATQRLRTESRGNLRRISIFGDGRIGAILHDSSLSFGEDLHKGMPDLRQVAEAVDLHYDFQVFPEEMLGAYLYHDWYVPLSNFSVHPSIPALSRYYRFRTGVIRKKPWGVIPRRGAIRVADGSIAFLLVAIQKSNDKDSKWLRSYGSRQIATANIPMVMLVGRAALGQGPGVLLRTVIAAVRHRAAFDDSAPRETRLEAMRAFQRVAHPGLTGEEVDRMAESLVGDLDGKS